MNAYLDENILLKDLDILGNLFIVNTFITKT